MAVYEVYNDENMDKWRHAVVDFDEGCYAILYGVYSTVGSFMSHGAYPGYIAVTKKNRVICHFNNIYGSNDFYFTFDNILQITIKRGFLDNLIVIFTYLDGKKKRKIKFNTPKDMQPKYFSGHKFSVNNLEEILKKILKQKDEKVVELDSEKVDTRCRILSVKENNHWIQPEESADKRLYFNLEKLVDKVKDENVAKAPVKIEDVGLGGGERYVISGSNNYHITMNMINESYRIRLIYGDEYVEGMFAGFNGEMIGITTEKYNLRCTLDGCDIEFLNPLDKISSEVSSEVSNDNGIKELYDEIMRLGDIVEEKGIDFVKSNGPAKKSAIDQWQNENGIKLPDEYKKFIILSNGIKYGMTSILPIEQVKKSEGQFGGYYVIGDFIGDGSLFLMDDVGEFYTGDHVFGIKKTDFKDFIKTWIIDILQEDSIE